MVRIQSSFACKFKFPIIKFQNQYDNVVIKRILPIELRNLCLSHVGKCIKDYKALESQAPSNNPSRLLFWELVSWNQLLVQVREADTLYVQAKTKLKTFPFKRIYTQ